MSDNEFEKWLKNYKQEQERTKDIATILVMLILFASTTLYAVYLSWGF